MNNNEEKKNLENLFNNGIAYLKKNQVDSAIFNFNKILLLRPNHPETLNFLSISYSRNKNYKEALGYINKAIKSKSTEPGFYINLGNILRSMMMYSESKEAYENALKLNSNLSDANYNIGILYAEQHLYYDAISYYNKAVEIDPQNKFAFDNLGIAYRNIGKINDSIKYFNKAIKIDKKFFESQFNLSLTLLLNENYIEGWDKYEYRLKLKKYQNKKFINDTKWDGSSLKNKKLLIYCEQGIGDCIQFARYIKNIKKEKSQIIILTNDVLKKFFIEFPEIDKVITKKDKLIKFDYYISIMSLPYIFRKEINHPNEYKFFSPNKKLCSTWKMKIKNSKKINIGLFWQGDSKNYKLDYQRSIELKKFKSIINLKGCNFVSLQKNYGSEEIKKNKFQNLICDYSSYIDKIPFEDTLAIIDNLDLVICVDTAIGHIAATLGKETWILVPHVPHYVWGLTGNKSKWYKSVTLFRQKKINSWEEIIEKLKIKLIEKYKLS